MADDGVLSQDDINAALAEAGLTAETAGSPAADAGGDASGGDEGLSQADIDAALNAAAADVPDARVDSSGRPFDEVAAAMAAAIEAEQAATPPPAPRPVPPGAVPMSIPELERVETPAGAEQGIDLLRDVELNVKIELGRTRMMVEDVLRLGEGSVVELDKLAGDPVDVFVNDRLVARGEVLVLNDNFCVRINDIFKAEDEPQDG